MTTRDAIKILVVDDLAEKLLVYGAILEEPGQEVVTAHSGDEALRQVLRHEFAVILLDVNMPGMDGFETARLIRSRRRSTRTPIIFVTAHADELYALRGYSHGAVDFIQAPVVPEVLRAKVRVFVELFRKTEEVQRQAEELRVLQARAHERQLRETNDRLQLAVEAGRLGAWEWSLGSHLLSWSPILEDILGFEPGGFSGATAELRACVHPEDEARVAAALSEALRTRSEFRVEHRVVRRRGGHGWVELLGRVFAGENGESPRLVGVCLDITERKHAEQALLESENRLRAMFGQAAVGIMLVDDRGRLLEANERLSQIVGRHAEELNRLSCEDMVHPDEWPACRAAMEEVFGGERPEFAAEHRFGRADGSWVWVNVTVSPLPDEHGRAQRLIAVVEDISARKVAEEEVRRHREHLEHLVRERTAELEASHQRLRVADRMASIGTLAAGLGHDMGNLLLPVRMRLDALRRMPLTDAALEDVAAIADACEYLKRLTQGLRLFALDGVESRPGGDSTDLAAWWPDVSPFLRHAVKCGIDLEGTVPGGLPPIPISSHLLTQAVYNLVQNAGDAMSGRGNGRIELSAALGADGQSVTLEVRDDGPGMSEDVLNRCMEPFFTTKTRGISTGLGLALVRGAAHQAGGRIEVKSRPGEGTLFRLTFPAAETPDDRAPAAGPEAIRACVQLSDARLRAYAASVLRSHGIGVVPGPWQAGGSAALLILDDSGGSYESLEAFLGEDADRSAIVLGGAAPPAWGNRADYLGASPTAGHLRDAIARFVRARHRRPQEASL